MDEVLAGARAQLEERDQRIAELERHLSARPGTTGATDRERELEEKLAQALAERRMLRAHGGAGRRAQPADGARVGAGRRGGACGGHGQGGKRRQAAGRTTQARVTERGETARRRRGQGGGRPGGTRAAGGDA